MQQRCQDVTEVRPDTFFSANPVEENLHTGMIDGLTVIKRLKEKKHFSYALAINNDYICPLYEGDSNRYIYAGAVGKLLPCFYIKGKETHVGQCFEGFDESLLAAELVKRAVEDIRKRGGNIRTSCSYAAAWCQRHGV